MPEISEGKYLVQIGWDDIPHLDDKARKDILDACSPHTVKARMRGDPVLEVGRIYPIDYDDVLYKPFAIPDYWPRCFALDTGYSMTAALFAAWDMESDIVYVYSEYYRRHAPPSVHAASVAQTSKGWIPGVYDPTADQRSKDDGRVIMDDYRRRGLKLFPADNSVQAGIDKVYERLTQGRLLFSPLLANTRFEFVLYRRDENGKIVKEHDHLMDCYSVDTEVLTKRGWVPFPKLAQDDVMATVNLDTDELEYQSQSAPITKRRHDGAMIQIGGRKMSMLVTPNHRMVVCPRGKQVPEFRRAGELSIWDRIKLHSSGVGDSCSIHEKVTVEGRALSALDMAAFMGWYVSEGSAIKKPQIPGRGYQVSISQNRPCPDLEQLLERLPWNFSYRQGSFHASSKGLWNFVREAGQASHLKWRPSWIRESGRSVIEAFVNAAVAGDGWIQRDRRNYATTSESLADGMQELFIKLGKSASIRKVAAREGGIIRGNKVFGRREQFWVSEWTSPFGHLRDSRNNPNFHPIPYSGMVYCATVPNGTLIVRRNGKPMIAGNCLRYLIMSGLRSPRPRSSPPAAWCGGATCTWSRIPWRGTRWRLTARRWKLPASARGARIRKTARKSARNTRLPTAPCAASSKPRPKRWPGCEGASSGAGLATRAPTTATTTTKRRPISPRTRRAASCS